MKLWLLITFLSMALFGFDIKTTMAKQHTFDITLSGYATLYPAQVQHIKAFQNGRIINLHLLDGMKVKKKEVLFSIKPYISPSTKLNLQHSINAANVNLQYAKDEFTRIKKLYKYKASYTKEFQKVKTKYLKAKLQYNTALQELALLSKTHTYKAPINATILNIQKKNLSFVKNGENILDLSNCHTLYAVAKVFDNDNQLKSGEEIRLLSNSGIYKSKIISILPKLAQNGAKEIVFYINQNKCKLFTNSIHKIIIYKKKFNTMAVPERTIMKHLKKRYVMVKTNNGFKRKEVKIGITEDNLVQIVNGLSMKDKIVTNGAYELFHKEIRKKLQILD